MTTPTRLTHENQKVAQLDQYRLLGRSGLRVSPLALGTMTFGEDWGWGAGEEVAREQWNMYADRGGNFIDTAVGYTNGSSETLVGKFLQGNRNKFVLATKYTQGYAKGDPNAGGNHRKNMIASVETSLKRLNTDYIDLFYLHFWDFTTPADEVMRAFDDLIRSGKILYAAISDSPAWKVAQLNTIAELRGWSRFIGLQIEYSLVQRDVERDLIPMAQELGLGVIPWGALNAGVLTGKFNPLHAGSNGTANSANNGASAEVDSKRNAGSNLNPRQAQISTAVQEVAQAVGRSPSQVAINWLMQQPGVTAPILGARRTEQLADNLAALDFTLEPEHVAKLSEVSQMELGFPHDFLRRDMIRSMLSNQTVIETGLGLTPNPAG